MKNSDPDPIDQNFKSGHTEISIRKPDLQAGFFRVRTSKVADWKRLESLVGGDIFDVVIHRTMAGVTYFASKVPARYLGKNLSIRKPRVLTAEQRKAASERMKKVRALRVAGGV